MKYSASAKAMRCHKIPNVNTLIYGFYSGDIWEKSILKYIQMINTFNTKNNIAQLYFMLGRAKLFIGIFQVDWGIFTDFQYYTWFRTTSCW